MAVAQEFGDSDDCRQRVAQIVRDRARHASDGRELFRLQQVALALEQAGTHAIEGTCDFRHFVMPVRVKGMMEVSPFEGAYAGDQTSQWPGEGVEMKKTRVLPTRMAA